MLQMLGNQSERGAEEIPVLRKVPGAVGFCQRARQSDSLDEVRCQKCKVKREDPLTEEQACEAGDAACKELKGPQVRNLE